MYTSNWPLDTDIKLAREFASKYLDNQRLQWNEWDVGFKELCCLEFALRCLIAAIDEHEELRTSYEAILNDQDTRLNNTLKMIRTE